MTLPAYFLMRAVRHGPLVAARLWLCDSEPDEPDNKLDRGRLSLYLRADIGGVEVEPERLLDRLISADDPQPAVPRTHWKWPQPIPADEYRYQLARLRWAEKHRADDPATAPRQRVDPASVAIPDFTREHNL